MKPLQTMTEYELLDYAWRGLMEQLIQFQAYFHGLKSQGIKSEISRLQAKITEVERRVNELKQEVTS
jgi:SMC interacting uncharacterized protein involved in chromosome segregation